MSKQTNYQAVRLAAGLCPKCGQNPCGKRRQLCLDCAIRHNARVLARINNRIAKDLCETCGQPRDPLSKRKCFDCLVRHRKVNRRAKRIERGQEAGV